MKRSSKILVAAALVLVVGGTAAAVAKQSYWRFGPDGAAFVQRLSEELKLDEQQSTQLESLRQLAVRLRGESRAGRDQHREQVLTLLSAPTLDQQEALRLLSEKTDTVTQRAPEVIAALAAFTDSLSAEQKGRIEAIAREHGANGDHCRHFGRRG